MKKVIKLLTTTWFLAVIIFLFAAAFRIPYLKYVEFKGDEALNLLLATRPLFHHPFPSASQASSAGILNFPLLNYLLFPIVIFTTYPPTISFVIALLNTFTIAGFFLLFKKYHGKLVAFLASCVLAFSPWAILYSRKIWAQDFLLPLSLPFFLSLYKIIEGKKRYWFLFGFTSMLLLQIHQLAIIVPFGLFIGLLWEKHKPQWRFLLWGIAIGLIPTIPYFWYAAQMNFSIFQANKSFIDRFSFHTLTTFLRPLQIISIGDFHTEMGNDFALFAQKFYTAYILSKFTYIAYIAVPVGAISIWIKEKTYKLFAVVCFAIIIFYFILEIEPLMHYYILLLPMLALFVAIPLRSVKGKLRIFLFVACGIYLLSLAAFDYAFLTFLSEKGGFAGDYGTGFASTELSAKTDLQKFTNNSDYKEIKLFYFAPREYFHGYMPVGKMIFPYIQLQQHEAAREKQFIKQSTNPILATEVFAYYTQNQNPDWNYVISLKEKTRQHPAFDFVYQKVLGEYLDKHLKKLYETPDFLLLYPKHWNTNKIKDGIQLTDGTIIITIRKTIAPMTHAILLRANYYEFTLEVVSQKKDNKTIDEYGQKVFEEVRNSVRTLK